MESESKILGQCKKLSLSRADTISDNKMTIAAEGLETYYQKLLTKKTSKENAR
jgi:hypothetical protein